MMKLASEVIRCLQGKTLATAESCTGGMISAALTAVPGASAVYKGGVVSYCNEIKQKLLGVKAEDLEKFGPVSAPVAQAMALGAKNVLQTDAAVSVTGLAGPGGDEFGNPVGTVFVGFCLGDIQLARKYYFTGDREAVRIQAAKAALQMILEYCR